ncbi:tyrosine-protein phosphatase [Streptomyces sp. WAC 00631]|uniref:tyrosine-protein phosphatase n=1 Tax=Streptomyces sp. WAC 00631 TaxID=2203201 RepID=UPI000F7853A8|nr:tyrosine-protein phosphatase [Streptomyces sp. WAC 00631]MCC5032692.1 tyrosine-protein phosphatase [Streptomyces sp. WAC 00631]
MDRHLDWDGCFNVRDLGGIPAAGGHVVRRGAVVRSDAVDKLSADGWAALCAHGIRTVIDLRNDDEVKADAAPRPSDLTTVHLPLDSIEDTGFWSIWCNGPDGTPLYYRPFLDHFPDRAARAVQAVAHARPGGVLVHCAAGRDRTGLVTLLLLALAGASPADIAADYLLSNDRLDARFFTTLGIPDHRQEIADYLARKGTTAERTLLAALDGFDTAAHLRSGGLAPDDVAALRTRLLEPGEQLDVSRADR